MESRKRPHADDGDISIPKKRALAGSNGAPHVNNVADQTEDEMAFHANIENFRKEAIYRRMKHYSRENERNLNRIEELERRKNTCEAGLAAISACWAQLIGTIRLLVKAEDLPPASVQAKDVFDIGARIEEQSLPELKSAFGETVNVTEALVNRFVKLGATQGSQVLKNDTFLQCQRAQTECATLRSQLDVLQKRLEDCENTKEKYHSDLVAAENRLERVQSQTVLSMEFRQKSANPNVSNGDSEDAQRKPSSPSASPKPPSPPQAPHNTTALEVAPETLSSREATIVQLEKENAALKALIWTRDAEPKNQSLEEHAGYKSMVVRLHGVLMEQHQRNGELAKLQTEINQLRQSRREWEESVKSASEEVIHNLRAAVLKRDQENTRLREQRDQQATEINERKQKESVKLLSIQELKHLVEYRAERIAILEAEVRRCKARLAANEGREDLMVFFLNDNMQEANFVESIKQQKEQIEIRAEALEHALSVYEQDHPDIAQHIRAHADAEERFTKVSAELEKFKKVYGELSTQSPDLASLAERLQKQATDLERLRLLNTQHQDSETSLFTELEKLSTAWETLDRQLKNKVFDLSHMEERLQKSVVEKAKSDNKYFAAMRDKEAIEMERKNMSRTLERQGNMLDHRLKTEQLSREQVESMESELGLLRKTKNSFQDKIFALESETVELKAQIELEKSKCQQHAQVLEKRDREQMDHSAQLRRTEEEWHRQRRAMEHEMQRLREEAAARVVHNPGQKEDAEYKHLRTLLLCSTCHSNFRSVIITKCMHTFCKPCVDARIATRQRKCPHCALPFAQSDVSTLYMQ